MGVTETVAATLDEYVALASKLGKDAKWRQEISDKIAATKHLVYQDMTSVTALENFLDRIVSERLRGESISTARDGYR
jgi:predicted O-linked N-acetylglucosamine transferase (SPINDLY family)